MSRPSSGETLSQLLHRHKLETGVTQKQLARELGKKESTVSLWVSGKQAPRHQDIETIAKLARLLRIGPDDLRARLISRQTDSSEPGTRPRSEHGPLDEPADAVHQRAIAEFVEPITDHDLRGKLRLVFAADSWIREAVRQACRRLNQEFFRQSEELDEPQLMALLLDSVRTSRERATENLSRALIQALCDLRLLERSGLQRYRRRWRINAEYVLNTVLGIPPLVDGLDFLLDGGLLVPSSDGLTAVIKGRSGTGKTTLAFQVAAALASQGHVSIFLSAEEPAGTLLERLSFIGYTRRPGDDSSSHVMSRDDRSFHRPWTDRRRSRSGGHVMSRDDGSFHLLCSSGIDAVRIRELFVRSARVSPGRGVLVLVTVPNRAGFASLENSLLTALDDLFEQIANERGGRRGGPFSGVTPCWVLDSLEAVLAAPDRRRYEELSAFARRHQGIGIFIAEEHEADPAPHLRDFLADLVIRLGYRQRDPAFIERVLEIEKSRTQSAMRGQHLYSIHSGHGITTYPSVQALLSVWRSRVTPAPSAELESWSLPPHLDFDRVLNRDLSKGSVILLSGPSATHKLAIGLSFLAAALRSQASAHVLLISLREDEATISRIVRTYPQLADLLDARRASPVLNQRFHVMHLRPDYYTAERFLHWVLRALGHFKQAGTPITRVLFNSLAQLRHNSPMYEHEKLFKESLVELFKKAGIASLFIDVGGQHGQEVQDIFDTLLFTERTESGGRAQALLRVGHSGPCSADHRARLFERVPLPGASGEMEFAQMVLHEPE